MNSLQKITDPLDLTAQPITEIKSSRDVKTHKQTDITSQSVFDTQTPQGKLESAFQLLENVIKTSKDLLVKDAFSVNDLEVTNRVGQKFKRTEFSTLVLGSVYSVTRTDYCIGITSLSYAASVGLPSPKDVGAGKTYLIKDEAGGAATTTITIRSTGDANIDGSTSATITTAYGSKMLYSDGNQWYVGLS